MKINQFKQQKKKIILSTLTIAAIATLTTIFTVNQFQSTDNTHAAEKTVHSTSAMPAPFVDQNFYNCVEADFIDEFPSEAIDPSGLTDEQLAKIETLNCGKYASTPDAEKVTNTAGLEKLTALTYLDVDYNQLTSLDVSHNANLTFISVQFNQLSSLNTSGATTLTDLYAAHNQLSSLDFSHNAVLTDLSLQDNRLTSLDLSNNPNIEDFGVDDILIKTSITNTQTTGARDIDLAPFKFIGDINTIPNTENYSFNGATKLLSVNNLAATNGYVQVVGREGWSATYKLQLFEGSVPEKRIGVPNTGIGSLGF